MNMSLPGSNIFGNGKMVFRFFLSVVVLIFCNPSPEIYCHASDEVITNSWYVQLHGNGGIPLAKQIAKRSGFTYISPILNSNTEFHFKHNAVPHARKRRSISHTRSLRSHPEVKLAVQQSGFLRHKRGYKSFRDFFPEDNTNFLSQNTKSMKNNNKRFSMLPEPTDPFYPKQWYLKNTGQSGGIKGLDLNVNMAWSKGYTGKNITTAIMDDGIDYLHEDIRDNYVRIHH